MDALQAIRLAADNVGGITAASVRMGRNRNFLSVSLSRGSMPRIDTVAHIADATDYVLAFVPSCEPLPSGSIEIDAPHDCRA